MSLSPKSVEIKKQLLSVHIKNRRDREKQISENQLLIDDTFALYIPENAERVMMTAARDAWDYLFTSMGVSIRLIEYQGACVCHKNGIIFRIGQDDLNMNGSFQINAGNNVTISGYDARGAAQGWYYLEERMNIFGLPAVDRGIISRKPLFSPRLTNSGYGPLLYPDQYLSQLAHLGIDAILYYANENELNKLTFMNINELIYRAEGFGIDVYFYSGIKSRLHPADPDAESYYENWYGKVFANCPGFKGVVLVGESVEFPSHDPHTTGRLRLDRNPEGLPNDKVSPGWWPCCDFPEWLAMIRKIVKNHAPSAEIVFWTYNWGYVEAKFRLELLKNLPQDITLLVTFEMFEKVRRGNITENSVDYTLFFDGPGVYFISEAEIAKRRGIKLYAMANSAGLTWDIGDVPYLPAPYLWKKRFDGLLLAHEKWDLRGIVESHEYGIWPSVISQLEKAMFYQPAKPFTESLYELCIRDFTSEYADKAMKAWIIMDKGFAYYASTNEDQYGPFRVGPSFPIGANIPFPHDSSDPAGNPITETAYHPHDNGRASLGNFRFPHEIKELGKMRDHMRDASVILSEIAGKLTSWRQENAEKLSLLARYIANCCQTTINCKRYYLESVKIASATDENSIRTSVENMREIGEEEIKNALDTIPIVEADPRLGWESSMGFMCDREYIEWKVKATKITLANLQMFAESLKYNYID